MARLTFIAQEEGLALPHLALGFVLEPPAVTSTLVGPRTVAQLAELLAAEHISMTPEALDEIDELIKPGTTINMSDAGYDPPELQVAGRRRNIRGAGSTSRPLDPGRHVPSTPE